MMVPWHLVTPVFPPPFSALFFSPLPPSGNILQFTENSPKHRDGQIPKGFSVRFTYDSEKIGCFSKEILKCRIFFARFPIFTLEMGLNPNPWNLEQDLQFVFYSLDPMLMFFFWPGEKYSDNSHRFWYFCLYCWTKQERLEFGAFLIKLI